MTASASKVIFRMNITLSKYWEDIIAEQIATGQYGSTSEVIQEALRE